MAIQEDYGRYFIPENMVDGNKIMNFPLRNVVEGCVLGGTVALLTLGCMQGSELSSKISAIIILAAPSFMLGVAGISGYPLSSFCKIAIQWIQKRGVMLYDSSVRLLEASPIDAKMSQADIRDRLIDIVEKQVEKTRTAEQGKTFIEGVDFKFAEDADEKGIIASAHIEDVELEGEVGESIFFETPNSDPAEIIKDPKNDLLAALGFFDEEEENPSETSQDLSPLKIEGEEGAVFEIEQAEPEAIAPIAQAEETQSEADKTAEEPEQSVAKKKPHRRGKKKKKGAAEKT